jgi:hypothetical protein
MMGLVKVCRDSISPQIRDITRHDIGLTSLASQAKPYVHPESKEREADLVAQFPIDIFDLDATLQKAVGGFKYYAIFLRLRHGRVTSDDRSPGPDPSRGLRFSGTLTARTGFSTLSH